MNIASIVDNSMISNKLQGLYKYLDENEDILNNVFENISNELKSKYENVSSSNNIISIKLKEDDDVNSEIVNIKNIVSSCVNSTETLDKKNISKYVFRIVNVGNNTINVSKNR